MYFFSRATIFDASSKNDRSMKRTFFYRNGLSLAFFGLAVFSLSGQMVTGLQEHNHFLLEHHRPAISMGAYLHSGHFLQATFENWESEFFQMALFVILTIFLRQEGSSESAPMDEDPKAGECIPHKNSPRALRKGGWYAAFYKHSLSIALILLFLVSFGIHWYGSWKDFNLEQQLNGEPQESFTAFLGNSKFWFESFQNWQSEFLSIFLLVFLSIYLRQKGSPQSKAVNAPHDETGE
jgi:hypothetical protein